MKCNWKITAAAVLLAATATALIFTQKNAATIAGQPAARPEDESAITAASQAFARAFEKGDAKALGKF
ncbi:MAG TPA: hypothetical protein VE988_24170, partial [Gemmataceae bacterium]|nr:hypothetical protein [Gemmataceae bacterium]